MHLERIKIILPFVPFKAYGIVEKGLILLTGNVGNGVLGIPLSSTTSNALHGRFQLSRTS